MLLLAMKGLSGSGKSTLSRALSREFRWPLIDKDDLRDLLDSRIEAVGSLAYDLMFNVARRQLLQGLNVICDSPLSGKIAYEHAQAIALETHADLGIIDCYCSNEATWKQRIDSRKSLHLPAHHQTDWESFQAFLNQARLQQDFLITHPRLIIDTARPLSECMAEILTWLKRLR